MLRLSDALFVAVVLLVAEPTLPEELLPEELLLIRCSSTGSAVPLSAPVPVVWFSVFGQGLLYYGLYDPRFGQRLTYHARILLVLVNS